MAGTAEGRLTVASAAVGRFHASQLEKSASDLVSTEARRTLQGL
jgi:hypothetical protein